MTIFGWDMSHYDWDRGLTATEIRAAAGQGIGFMTHKIGEGTGNTDPRFDDFWHATRGLPTLLGAYYVNHPGNQQTQADRFLSLLDSLAKGWRDKAFILQVDAEKFDYMPREPNLGEIRAFVGRLRAKAPQCRPVVYAPRWLYGDRLSGLGSPLWASNYGDNPARPYRQAYPGDGSPRWTAYSGQTPALLQYGSRTRISTQATCDANAFRGTLDQLHALVYPQGGDDMSWSETLASTASTDARFGAGDHSASEYLRLAAIHAYDGARAAGQAATAVLALRAVVDQLAETIRAGGGSVDTAAILAGVDERLAALPERTADAVVAEIAS